MKNLETSAVLNFDIIPGIRKPGIHRVTGAPTLIVATRLKKTRISRHLQRELCFAHVQRYKLKPATPAAFHPRIVLFACDTNCYIKKKLQNGQATSETGFDSSVPSLSTCLHVDSVRPGLGSCVS